MDAHYPECFLCNIAYERSAHSPKVLDCGHSVCFACLYKLLETVSPCPKCLTPLTKHIDDYVTNYDLKTECENIRLAFRDVRLMITKFKDFLSSFEASFCVDDRITIKTEKGKLRELIKETINSINDRASKNVEGAAYADVRPKVTVDSVSETMHRICEPQPRNFFCVDHYLNEDQFLYEICVRLQKGEVIYACDIIHELCQENDYFYQWKYGKLSWAEGRMYIHCLSLSTVDRDSICVHLQDLKRCLEGREIAAFIDVGKRLYLTLIRSSYSTLQFLKYCTGEAGDMLKGSIARFHAEALSASEKSTATDDTESTKEKSGEKNLSVLDTTNKAEDPADFDKTNNPKVTDESNISEVIDRTNESDTVNIVNISNTIRKLSISDTAITLNITDDACKSKIADASIEKKAAFSLTRTKSNSSDESSYSPEEKSHDPKDNCAFGVVGTQSRDRIDYDITIDSKVRKTYKKDDLIIQCFHRYIYVQRVPEDTYRYSFVVAKVQEDCAININDLKSKTIEDCGISFDVLMK